MATLLRNDFLDVQKRFQDHSKSDQGASVEPDLVEVVEMHHREADLRDGLVRPADLGALPDEPSDRFPNAADGEESEQDQHDDPVHATAAVRLPAEHVPETERGGISSKLLKDYKRIWF